MVRMSFFILVIILGLTIFPNSVSSLFKIEKSSDLVVPPVIQEWIDKFDWKVSVGDNKSFKLTKYNTNGIGDGYIIEGVDKFGKSATINVSAGTTFVVTITYLNLINESFGAIYPRGTIIYNDEVIVEYVGLQNLLQPTYINKTYWINLVEKQGENNDSIYRMVGDDLVEWEYHAIESMKEVKRWNWRTGWTYSYYKSEGNSTHLDSEMEILDKDAIDEGLIIPDLGWPIIITILTAITLVTKRKRKSIKLKISPPVR